MCGPSLCLPHSQLYTSKVPFSGVPDKQIPALVKKGTLPERPLVPGSETERMADNLWDLLVKCWDADPMHRPEASDIVDSLDVLVHGPRKPAPIQTEGRQAEKSEKPEAQLRSASPMSVSSDVTSPPDTPLDTPTIGALQQRLHVRRAQSVDIYSPIIQEHVRPVKDVFPEDVPPPPYQAVDPAIQARHAPARLLSKASSDDTSSTAGSSAGTTPALSTSSQQAEASFNAPAAQASEEQSSPVTVLNEVKNESHESFNKPVTSPEEHVPDEQQITTEQPTAAQEPVISDTTHDEPGELLLFLERNFGGSSVPQSPRFLTQRSTITKSRTRLL